jgi:hypothetical protein
VIVETIKVIGGWWITLKAITLLVVDATKGIAIPVGLAINFLMVEAGRGVGQP